MPLGFERLNERQQRPNVLINFIKPLDGPDKATSEEFLSRIAAQCYPVMKKHHISVMTLQEHEPNSEFLGRNFNAGELIELVLKDRQGRWLSMKFVQMVMMHELAHCKQMNHSRFFWGVRNEYAQQMEGLWREKYLGEGMWGRGRGLANGAFIDAAPPDTTQIPAHLCGGSYRRRGRKRKRGGQHGEGQTDKLSYAERQQRRIARKFGKHGDGSSLGEDDLLRGALETMNGGKRGQGKPKVANSKRGRELRAAAALARFERQKHDSSREQTPDMEQDLDSETESEWEDDASLAGSKNPVIIRDGCGHDMVKVCGDGEDDGEGADKERDELLMLSAAPPPDRRPSKTKLLNHGQEVREDSETESDGKGPPRLRYPQAVRTFISNREDPQTEVEKKNTNVHRSVKLDAASDQISQEQVDVRDAPSQPDLAESTTHTTAELTKSTEPLSDSLPPDHTETSTCPMCSVENDADSTTCMVCSNVLRPKLMPNHWRCQSETCNGNQYINAGDAGRCGICGASKPKVLNVSSTTDGREFGLTRPEVLRWD